MAKLGQVGAPDCKKEGAKLEEERFFIGQVLRLVGRERGPAHEYGDAQVEALFPEAKGLIYERAALNGCRIAGLEKGKQERVVIIADKEKEEMARAFHEAAAAMVGKENVSYINIDDEAKYGKRPFTGQNAALWDEIRAFKPGVSFFAATTTKGEESDFRIQLIEELLVAELKCAHAHSPNLTPRMMADGMLTDHATIVRLTERVEKIVTGAEKIRVATPAGADITLTFVNDGSIKWVPSHTVEKGTYSNLPTGEIYTCPRTANGTVVVDGVLGSGFAKYGRLESMPVKFTVVDGYCTDVKVLCKKPEDKELVAKADRLEKELREFLWKSENSNRVGELGIGTNIGLESLIGAILQDEKFPGAHIAFGHPLKEKTKAPWGAKTHLDGVMTRCTIEVFSRDGGMVRMMRDGKFTAAVLDVRLPPPQK